MYTYMFFVFGITVTVIVVVLGLHGLVLGWDLELSFDDIQIQYTKFTFEAWK